MGVSLTKSKDSRLVPTRPERAGQCNLTNENPWIHLCPSFKFMEISFDDKTRK